MKNTQVFNSPKDAIEFLTSNNFSCSSDFELLLNNTCVHDSRVKISITEGELIKLTYIPVKNAAGLFVFREGAKCSYFKFVSVGKKAYVNIYRHKSMRAVSYKIINYLIQIVRSHQTKL